MSFGRPPAADYAFTPPAGARVIQQHDRAASRGTAGRAVSGLASDVRVIGTGWLAVASLPESALAALSGGGRQTCSRSATRASSEAPGSAAPGGPAAAPAGSLLGELLNSAPRVSGSWGSGRLHPHQPAVGPGHQHRPGAGRGGHPGVLYHAVTQPGRPLPALGQHTSSRARPK